MDHDEIMCAMCPDTAFALCARNHLGALDSRKENAELLVEQAHQLVTSSETAIQERVKTLIEEYLEKLYFLLHGPIVSRMLQQRLVTIGRQTASSKVDRVTLFVSYL